MRNFFLSMMAFVTILSSTACSDSSATQDPNLTSKEANIALKDIGKTVPVGMTMKMES
jgi:outer membrane protein assembly factor BamE (lipoprotein component of BamABCDE complex)